MVTEITGATGHAAEHVLAPSVYIAEHLWDSNGIGGKQASVVNLSVINRDMTFWSVLMGLISTIVLGIAARRVTAGVSGRFQAFVKLVVEMINDQAEGIAHSDRSWTAPLALMVFVWVMLMNAVDLVPVGWVVGVSHPPGTFNVHVPHYRAVTAADLDSMSGISFTVLILMIYYSFRIKGAGDLTHELLSAPFGAKWYLTPFNLVLNITEFLAKAASPGIRLFGNMYADELIFLLIALFGSVWMFGTDTLALGFVGHVVAGAVRVIFHVLIMLLQAFIFMMLMPVYIGQVHRHH